MNSDRILITRIRSSSLPGPVERYNSVTVHRGGELVEKFDVPVLSRWDKEARNQLGHAGAAVCEPDVAAIRAATERLRTAHPDLPISDNVGALADG